MSTVSVFQGSRADWVGRLPVLCFSNKQVYIQYIGLTDKDHGHYPMVTLYSMPSQDFHKWFKLTKDPAAIYAKIYSEHARLKGITGEAAELLATLIPNDEWNIDMAGKKKTDDKAPVLEPKKPAASKTTPNGVKAADTVKPAKAAAAPKAAKETKPTAAPKATKETKPAPDFAQEPGKRGRKPSGTPPVVAALSRPRKDDGPVNGEYPTKASMLRAMVKKYKDDAKALEAVKVQFPNCNMTSVAYYRAQVEASAAA